MDDLMKCLYEFVQTHRMGSLNDNEEYEEYIQTVKLQRKRVEGYLDKDQRDELNLLIEAVTFQGSIVNEHTFQAALGLARELNALVGA